MSAPETPVGFGSTHLVVGVPACGRLTTVRWGINLASQQYPMSMAIDYASPVDTEGKEVGLVRNAIASYALNANAKYIWMVDDDVLPPQFAVQRLLHAMQNRPEVMACGGIYYSKQDVPAPVVFADDGTGPFYNWKPGEVFEVPGFIGTGCLLIRTEVFQRLETPWFETIDTAGKDKVTDDAFFCRKVIAAGYKILGHGGVICGHFNHQTGKVVWPPEDDPAHSLIIS